MHEYEVIEHTADVGLKIKGENPEALFSNAGKGIFSIILREGHINPKESLQVTVDAADFESLLVEWLNELIYLFDVNGFLAGEFKIKKIEKNRLEAEIRGEKYNENRHELGIQIKAATFHNLNISKNQNWEASVIFDV